MHCEHGVFKQRLNTGSLPTCESLLCECDFVPPTQLDCLLGTLHSVRGEPAESLTDTATLVMREAASLWLAENTIMLHPETMLPPNKLAILDAYEITNFHLAQPPSTVNDLHFP